MPIFIANNNPNFEHPIQLSAEDEHHLLRVMRIKKGGIIKLTDNQGNFAKTRLASTQPLEFEILEIKPGESPEPITLHLPLINQDRLEWAIQKLCELNIKTIQLTVTERSQQRELSPSKLERLNKIAITAQKQCERTTPLEIKEPKNLFHININQDSLNIVGSNSISPSLPVSRSHSLTMIKSEFTSASILIGPEGGFSAAEIKFFEENNIEKINLGATVLRTETAAIILTTLVKYHSI